MQPVAEEVYQEQVPAALSDQRVDRVVAMVADVSRRQAAALIAAGHVLVDGVVVERPSLKLELGQELVFRLVREQAEVLADSSVEITLVHVDDDVIVVDKQAGLVVHPGSGVKGATLVNGLLSHFPELATVGQRERPGLVHRLDRGTSGLLVVARSDRAYDHLVDQLRRRSVERRYRSLVVGSMEADSGLIDAPLGRSPRNAIRRAVVADGLEARTFYEVTERWTLPASSDDELTSSGLEFTLVQCRLETGRTHQIRAHLAAIGHPVVADVDYGGAVTEPEEAASLARPFLHAEQLSFDHPISGTRLQFTSPLPEDLVVVLEALRRGDKARTEY